MITVIAYLLIPLLLLAVGGIAGSVRERRHLADLDRREAEVTSIVVTDLRTPPPGMQARSATLVVGEVVVATDYFKQFAASLRSIVGGEVRSYRNVMGRARREAQLRMIEEARRAGADLVVNTRFTTSEVIPGASEIICYGTAVRTGPG